MRVIAGTARGTRLYGAKGYRVRPITDRIKESLFELLADRLEGVNVLDLFAGVGLLGIEALSRGAAHADFVEKHAATASSIRENLERTHLGDRARVIVGRLPGVLSGKRLSPKGEKARYGLIFVDPPFRIESRLTEEVFHRIGSGGLLEEGGLVVYRHAPGSQYEPPADEWELENRRDYGGSVISMYHQRSD